MGKNKKTKALKEIKKRWLGIVAPEMFNRLPLGDSLVEDGNALLNKCILVNLMDVTRSIKQQNISLRMKVDEVKDNIGLTKVIGYEMNPSSIKRMVRREIEKIDDSFMVSTSDGKFIRLKPLVIARSAAKSSVAKAIRKETRNFLIREIAKTTYEDFVKAVVSNAVQMELSKRLNKIYPMKIATIRRFDVVENIKGKKLPTAEEEKIVAGEEVPVEEEATEGAEEMKEEVADEAATPAAEEEEKPKKKKAKKAEEEVKEEVVEDAPPSD